MTTSLPDSAGAEQTTVIAPPDAPVTVPRSERRSGLARFRLAAGVYLATRLALLLLAVIEHAIRHVPVIYELANWDGRWFRALAVTGYPAHVAHAQTTLGFFPLYPALMRLLGGANYTGVTVAGLIISALGGLVATLLVQELATGWWGESAGRRAALLYSLFPGSVVFSMVYSEGLLLPLAAGCILALERRRWLLAGVLAGAATALEPDALAIVPVCAVAAALAVHRRREWRALLAPVLSLTGAAGFAAYLWAHTGTPLANYYAQHYGWGEKSDVFALVHQARSLADEVSFAHFNHPTINLNLVAGLAGAVFLAAGVVLLVRRGRGISVEAAVWTAAVGLLTVTSEFVPPNPRLLITAFPVVVVFARVRRPRLAIALNAILLIGMSYLTLYGHTLRP
jgi:hypothetical protein